MAKRGGNSVARGWLRRAFLGGAFAIAVASTAACGSGDDRTQEENTPTALPNTRAANALQKLLNVVNGPVEDITPEAVAPLLHATFLLEISARELAALLSDLAEELAPFELGAVDARGDTSLAVTLIGRGDVYLRGSLAVAGPGTSISALAFQLAPELDPELQDRQALETRVSGVAPGVSALVASIDSGACSPLASVASETAQPLGSLFKIYVLGALVDAVAAGHVSWTDALAVREDWKSLPSGVLQTRPAGSELPLQEYANGMIEISDNTATDHLIHHLGRERVEAQQAVMGHAAPGLNLPFMTTRELFWLKLAATDADRRAYAGATVDARRETLDRAAGLEFPADLVDRAQEWTLPRDIDSLEWFASPTDLCRAFAWLAAQGGTEAGDPALAALARNPGIVPDAATFSYIGFKGGSEPGVLATAWLMRRRADDSLRFVALLSSDPRAAIAETRVLYHALALTQFAGREPR